MVAGEQMGVGMSERNNSRPIVVKRKKVVAGGGHHGGAWKVAYADFVTAMMAFFLMLWLLGATTEDQRRGLADYFSPSLPVYQSSAGGDGAFGGDSAQSDDTLSGGARGAGGESGSEDGMMEFKLAGEPSLPDIEAMLLEALGDDPAAAELLHHLMIRMTDDGLLIELFDREEAPLFAPDTADPGPVLQMLAELLGEVMAMVSNPVLLDGHVRARAVVERTQQVWELSVERPQQFRRLLEGAGVDPARVRRLTGHGDRLPATSNSVAPRNNRIEMLLARHDAVPQGR